MSNSIAVRNLFNFGLHCGEKQYVADRSRVGGLSLYNLLRKNLNIASSEYHIGKFVFQTLL